MRSLLIPFASATLVVGCVSADVKDNAEQPAKQEKEYVTGSNLPKRDRSGSGVDVVSREGLERIQRTTGGLLTK